jgi:hypothetical protein
LAKVLLIFFRNIFQKLTFCFIFFNLCFINFCSNLYYFFLLILGFVCSCFSKSLRYIIRLFKICFLNVGAHDCKLFFLALLLRYPKGSVNLYFHFHLILGIF